MGCSALVTELIPLDLGALGALAVKQMRILVTGGAGFIGSHVVDAYVQAGHEVWVLDDLSRGKREQVNPDARFIHMDVRSPGLGELLRKGGFDCINRLAAQIDVRVSVADPAQDAAINIVGTLNLLEAARVHGIPRMIFASTGGAICGVQRHFPASEEHPTAPMSPYGVSKLAVEHYLEYYRQVHGLQYAVLRFANVYGPRQDPEGEAGVVAIFCGRILRGQQLIVYGDGEQTRDYVYVGDVARANVLALRHLTQRNESIESVESGARMGSRLNNVFNIGTGIETSVNALAAILLRAADASSPVVHQPCRPGEQARSAIAPTKAAHILGWKPLISLAEGLHRTLAWFRGSEAGRVQRPPVSLGPVSDF